MDDPLGTKKSHEEGTEEELPQPPQEVVDPREPDPSPPEPNVDISGAREARHGTDES